MMCVELHFSLPNSSIYQTNSMKKNREQAMTFLLESDNQEDDFDENERVGCLESYFATK